MFKGKITSIEDVFKSDSEKRGFVINLLMCILTLFDTINTPFSFNFFR